MLNLSDKLIASGTNIGHVDQIYPQGDIIYHYSGYHGLIGIVDSKSIWTSHFMYSNDYMEYRYALDVLAETAARLKKSTRDSFLKECYEGFELRAELGHEVSVLTASFSDEGNALNQWRSYCPQGGVSIGFGREEIAHIASQNGYTFARVDYDPKSHARKMEAYISSKIDDLKAEMKSPDYNPVNSIRIQITNKLHKDFPLMSSFIKHESFSDEKEWRLAKTMNGDRFRASNGGLIPYREFPVLWNGTLPIFEIVIGPGPNQPLAMHSAMTLVASRRLRGCAAVSMSEVPHRH